MDPGPWLLLAALSLAGAGAASALLHALTGRPAAERRAGLLGLGAAALAGLAWLTLLAHFLARNDAVYAVWHYSDAATPAWLRATGTWAGASGSLLLWTVLLGMAFAAEEAWRRRARPRGQDPSDPRSAAFARAVMLGLLAVFLLLTVQAMPFAPTVDHHLDGTTGFFTYQPGMRHLPDPLDFRPEGFGLNPLLQTPFMAVHPPVEFLAYAAAAWPFAYAAGHLARRDPRWWAGALAWARWAWMFFAVGLGLGALWAYYVLSFGGYWAWDPVEVGDLLPFLGLTAFLHAADQHRKGKGWEHYAPFLAALAFPLVLLATFVTRSSFWISAHAFDVGEAAVVSDPARRLLGVLGAKPHVEALFALLLAVLAGLAALHLARLARAAPGRAARLRAPALALLAAWLVVLAAAALDVGALLQGLFGLGAALGAGNLLLGLALLGLVLVGAPVALAVLALGDEEEPSPWRPAALLEPDALMGAGVVLLSLGLLVTAAILLVGVNFTVGDLARAYDARVPLVVLPLALVLTMRLSVKAVGPRRAGLLALGSLALGMVLYLVLPPGLRLLGVGVPVLGVALGAGIAQLLRAAAKASPAPRPAQAAGALVLLSALAGVAMWASPPTALALGPWVAPVPLALVPLGLGASLAAFVLGVAAIQGEGARAALVGALLGMAGLGYGLGLALGLAALALAWRARGAFAARGLRAAVGRVRGRLYGTGRWAAHVAVLLVFIGYGASAYHAQERAFESLAGPLERGVPQDFAGYTLTLADGTGRDVDGDGAFEEVTAWVAVARGGALLDVAPIRFTWVEKESQYRASEHVVRQPLGDLYLNSDPSHLPAVRTAADGWVRSFQAARFAAGEDEGKLRSEALDALALSVKHLPMVAPLWAGALLLPFSMALTLAGAPPRGFVKGSGKGEAKGDGKGEGKAEG